MEGERRRKDESPCGWLHYFGYAGSRKEKKIDEQSMDNLSNDEELRRQLGITISFFYFQVLTQFKDRLEIYKSWAYYLIGCELLNLLNLILQIWLTDV